MTIDERAGARAEPVRDELADLKYLGMGGTARLERALLDATLLLATPEVANGVAGADVFTGIDRWTDALPHRRYPAEPRRYALGALWVALHERGVRLALLDPGHPHAIRLHEAHLRRLWLRATRRGGSIVQGA